MKKINIHVNVKIYRKKSLKIPKGSSKTVNRRTDNTMAKSKGTKSQATIFKTLYRKLTIEQHEPL